MYPIRPLRIPVVQTDRPAAPPAQRRTLFVLGLLTVLVVGCQTPKPFALEDRKPRSDRDAPFDPPKSYPEWAYDAPYYQKPADDPKMEAKARPEDPDHYFINKRLVPVRQPGGYTPEMIPRVAVWYTDNNGFEWKRAGYFGQAQSVYWFEAPADGDYGVRFVGPGQESAKTPVAEPIRVYHVDTVVPDVELVVEPNQAWYNPGQQIQLSWKAHDFHLVEQPCEVGMTTDFSSDKPGWTVLQKDQAAEGSYTFTIPTGSVGRGLVFRVAAADRAGNLGFGFSHLVQVVTETAQGAGAPQSMSPQSTPMSSNDPAWQGQASFQEQSTGTTDGGMQPTQDTRQSGWQPAGSSPQQPTNWSSDGEIETITPVESQSSSGTSSDLNLILNAGGGTQSASSPPVTHSASQVTQSAATPPSEFTPAPAGTPIPAATPARSSDPTIEEILTDPPAPATPPSASPPAMSPPPVTTPKPAPTAKPTASPAPAATPSESIETVPVSPSAAIRPSKMGIVAPLPATVATPAPAVAATDRPWMQLGKDKREKSVWKLPQPSFVEVTESLKRMRFYMENPEMVPAGPGARTDRPVAAAEPTVDPALDDAVRPQQK